MCDHNIRFAGDNAHCIWEDCNWCGPYMLPAPSNDGFGTARCPKCGEGKILSRNTRLIKDPFFIAIEAYMEGGD